MYEWKIDCKGTVDHVIQQVASMDIPKCTALVPRSVVQKSIAGPDGLPRVVKSTTVHEPVDVPPRDEDLRDFERIRSMVLAELQDIELPYAAVTVRYVENPPPQGGYSLVLNISAYPTLTPEIPLEPPIQAPPSRA